MEKQEKMKEKILLKNMTKGWHTHKINIGKTNFIENPGKKKLTEENNNRTKREAK